MYEWNAAIQKMIDWIEEHITENPSLLEMSKVAKPQRVLSSGVSFCLLRRFIMLS